MPKTGALVPADDVARAIHVIRGKRAFTENGAVMLASILNSPVAVDASIMVVRAFVQLCGMLAEHQELARKLDELERKYDTQFRVVFDAIRHLMDPAGSPEHKRIGFQASDT